MDNQKIKIYISKNIVNAIFGYKILGDSIDKNDKINIDDFICAIQKQGFGLEDENKEKIISKLAKIKNDEMDFVFELEKYISSKNNNIPNFHYWLINSMIKDKCKEYKGNCKKCNKENKECLLHTNDIQILYDAIRLRVII